jgi:hypothetical protein
MVEIGSFVPRRHQSLAKGYLDTVAKEETAAAANEKVGIKVHF